MALVRADIAFDGPVPDWRQVADKVAELTGLSVVVKDFDDAQAPIEIWFAPNSWVGERDIYPDRRYVTLESWSFLEPTLIIATELALESLGGRLRGRISKEDREYFSTRITPSELEERKRKYWWRNLPAATVETIFGAFYIALIFVIIGFAYLIRGIATAVAWLVKRIVGVNRNV